MDISLMAAEIAGVYLIIVGVSFILRQKMWSEVIHDFARNRMAMTLAGLVELLIGIVIVMYHNVWVADWQVAITLIGWLMVLEGGAYVLLPTKTLKDKITKFNKKGWYSGMGVIAIGLGAYLLYVSIGGGAF
jgi:uncharacterized membrane protein